MRPSFRTDLTCSREEQQGVVFYRIDDLRSAASFRLYEIEFLIAQKLDGTRTLGQVVRAIKEEYNFEISRDDLKKFVEQLVTMGFVLPGDARGFESEPSISAQTPAAAGAGGASASASGTGPGTAPGAMGVELLPAGTPPVDRSELERLLRSAFVHIKQGYGSHARDYLLAARDADRSNEGVRELLGHLDAVGEAGGPAEVQYLWTQARRLFPQIAEAVGPLLAAAAAAAAAADADARGGGPRHVAQTVSRQADAWERNARTRFLLTAALLLFVVGLAGGAVWAVVALGVFDMSASVRVLRLRPGTVALTYPETALRIQPVRDEKLSFEAAGRLAMPLPEVGSAVGDGDFLARLLLPAELEEQLREAQQAVTDATRAHDEAALRLSALFDERARIEKERLEAEQHLKQVRPQAVPGSSHEFGVEFERWKRQRINANRNLSDLARREHAPREQEQATAQALDVAGRRLGGMLYRIRDKLLRAPFAGVIVWRGPAWQVGQPVVAGAGVLRVRDTSGARVMFRLHDAPEVGPGGQLHVLIGDDGPDRRLMQGKVVAVGAAAGEAVVPVEVLVAADPTVADLPPASIRLVRTLADAAVRVPDTAVFQIPGETPRVFLEVDGRAVETPVEVLQRDGETAVIVATQARLQTDAALIVSGPLFTDAPAGLADGLRVRVVGTVE